jgi:putative zinc finger protein
MSEAPARCAPFEEDLSALLDAQLDAHRAGEVRAHLASCAACARRLDRLRGVDAALQRIAATPVDAAQRARMRPVLAPERSARRVAPPRRRRWIAPAALVATAAAAASLYLTLRPAQPVATPAAMVAVVEPSLAPRAATTQEDAEVAARKLAENVHTPMGASTPPSAAAERTEPVGEAAGGSAAPDLLDDASDEDLALATALRELPVLDSPRDLEVVEQLDLLERLGSLDGDKAGRG